MWWGFLSVDPLAHQFASQTPYNFVFNSPISFIDPDGRAPEHVETEIFNKKGKKVGEDENGNDGNISIVNNEIVDKFRNGDISATEAIASGNNTTRGTLEEIMNVQARGKANGGLREESSLVLNDGTVLQGETGPMPTFDYYGSQRVDAELPSLPQGITDSDVQASIHLHPFGVTERGNQVFGSSASIPSGPDIDAFKRFGKNIIVGFLESNPKVSGGPDMSLAQTFRKRTRGAVFIILQLASKAG